MSANSRYILTLSCPDARGIVAATSGFLVEQDCNIAQSHQFEDRGSGQFFMRTVFEGSTHSPDGDALRAAFGAIGRRFGMEWRIHDAAVTPKVVILVSKFGHCLNDLLYRRSIGAIPMDVTAVISNHPDMRAMVEHHQIPYHHLPVTKETKPAQEAEMQKIIAESGADLIVLARYMQVLSAEFCKDHSGRIINIHHSFLPSFKGAKPYHQAYQRGVKLIGATAHYVTSDLDEGPIIEQETARITHAQTPEEMIGIGRDLESVVLARAVRFHCEHRVLMNGSKTIVFQ
ncbi:MAG: formyltetrahydrofolate deformylase [Magnetospiraceae bacterium]